MRTCLLRLPSTFCPIVNATGGFCHGNLGIIDEQLSYSGIKNTVFLGNHKYAYLWGFHQGLTKNFSHDNVATSY